MTRPISDRLRDYALSKISSICITNTDNHGKIDFFFRQKSEISYQLECMPLTDSMQEFGI